MLALVREDLSLVPRRAPLLGAPVFSHFQLDVHGADGELKLRTPHRHNLTTDAASGYTNRRDWQSKLMGGGFAEAAAFKGTAAVATPPTATTFTIASGSLPTAGQGLAGGVVWASPAAGGAMVYGVIASNTATVFTVDQWYDPSTGAAGTTPGALSNYAVAQGQNPARYLALTANATAPANTDTTLTAEITTADFARKIGVYAHTAAASTYTLQAVFNATTTQTINKEAVFGALNPTAGGVMPFESAEPNPPTLVSGDQLTQTVTITIG